MYDVVIIGGGIVGCSLFYALSRYQLQVLLLEKENDLALGATKANSGIVHAGYDPTHGTLMQKTNIAGCNMMPSLCQELDVPYQNIGSLVLAFTKQQEQHLSNLYQLGVKNGVPGMRILPPDELLEKEPALNPEVRAALYAPTAGIVGPWELALAQAETAVLNGGEVKRNASVQDISHENDCFFVHTGSKTIKTRFILNAAGLASAQITALLEPPSYTIVPSRGQYYVLDKSQGELLRHVIFQCPGPAGKGVLLTPTVHGNLMAGPNSEPATNKNTTATALAAIKRQALQLLPNLQFSQSIRHFSGLRARSNQPDFVLRSSVQNPGFIELGGIASPGLTAAPALAINALKILEKSGLILHKKTHYKNRPRVLRFSLLSPAEKNAVIHTNPQYGTIVCRCEGVTEGEIVDAMRRPIPPCSLDGVKRRCGAGMGRCQGGFCGPRVEGILARENNVSMEEIPLDRAGMNIVLSPTKTPLAKKGGQP